ncbi:MAG TPA: amidohydrolase family protein [Steroidobacteraceae bacterium]|jgi:predicted TIM-barrel fold metal-dependent hydrolase
MNPQRIDVHHHFLPPDFLADLKRQGAKWTGGPPLPVWNVAIAREVMERYNIAAAVASTVPSPFWGDTAAAAHWARHANEFAARIVHDDPAHFGYFASVPLPDTAAALREVEYALDVLKLDGVQLFSSYGNQYPGDPQFDELFQELERRKAIVHIHPSTVVPGAIVPKLSIPWGVVEFVLDTTRCVTNLLASGTFERYPSIRYIVSHAGGTVPYIAWRIAMSAHELPDFGAKAPQGALHYLKKLYYDTALSTSEQVLAALREFVPTSQVLFGSDWPMVPETAVQMEHRDLEASKVLDDTTRRAIYQDSALALFPRFANTVARKAA